MIPLSLSPPLSPTFVFLPQMFQCDSGNCVMSMCRDSEGFTNHNLGIWCVWFEG